MGNSPHSRREVLKKLACLGGVALIDSCTKNSLYHYDFDSPYMDVELNEYGVLSNFFPLEGTTAIGYNVDYKSKKSAHQYPTDLFYMFVNEGIRDPASTDYAGKPADNLSFLLFLKKLYGYTSKIFLHNEDGTRNPHGLDVSLCLPHDERMRQKEMQKICFRWESPEDYPKYNFHSSTVGVANLDRNNKRLDCVCGEYKEYPFGIFLEQFSRGVRSRLAQSHVNESDIKTLTDALLFDIIPEGAEIASFGGNFFDDGENPLPEIPAPKETPEERAVKVYNTIDYLALWLSQLGIHEFGHTLGLEHSERGAMSAEFFYNLNKDSQQFGLSEESLEKLRDGRLTHPGVVYLG